MQWDYEMLVIEAETPGLMNLTGGQFSESKLYREMNRLGRDGWELVTGFDTNFIRGATQDIVLLFKRPRRVLPTAEPVDG